MNHVARDRPPAADSRAAARYGVYGLTLVTTLPLRLPPAGASDATVELAEGAEADFPADFPGGAPAEWVRQRLLEDGRLHMRWGTQFEILVSADGRKVLCRNLDRTALETFEAYLTNFAVSAALILQGEEPLHATVVDLGGRAVALVGPSGAGKSTLAAFLMGRGAALVTDDMLRVTFEGATAHAQPGPYRIKLFREPASRYLPGGVDQGFWSLVGEKLILAPDGPAPDARARRLTAIYHLDAPAPSEDAPEPRVERLSGLALFTTILASSMNSRLHAPDRLARQFRFAERLTADLPVFRLTYRRDFEALEKAAKLIHGSAPP